MTIEFRWVTYENKVTREQITEHADTVGIPKMHAKEELIDRKGPILQYRVMRDVTVWAGMPTQEQIRAMANYQWSPWMDVQHITEYRS